MNDLSAVNNKCGKELKTSLGRTMSVVTKLVSNSGQGVTSQSNQAWLSLSTTCTENEQEKKQREEEGSRDTVRNL